MLHLSTASGEGEQTADLRARSIADTWHQQCDETHPVCDRMSPTQSFLGQRSICADGTYRLPERKARVPISRYTIFVLFKTFPQRRKVKRRRGKRIKSLW